MIDPEENQEFNATVAETVADRLELVVAEFKISKRSWSLQAGRSHSHLANLITRLREDPAHDVSAWVLADYCHYLDISLDWLVLGRGHMRGHRNAEADLYPMRTAVLTLAGLFGISDEACRMVATEEGHATDPGAAYWFGRMTRAGNLVADRPSTSPLPRVERKSRPKSKK